MIFAGERSILPIMARDIDDRKKRKALRKLRKAAERAEAENGPGLSDWEREFVEEVEMRVEKYGSAFADPEKGNLDEPLSALQTRKLKEIDKKSRGKGSSFKTRPGFSKSKKKQGFTPRSRDIHEDIDAPESAQTPKPEACHKLKLVAKAKPERPAPETGTNDSAPERAPEQARASNPSPFRVIIGGKDT